ncbi:MAG TPA: PAS domain-containing protein [Mesorhizobium sp.]|nr:PAS domain-containing protein [Mesorhizobium sp.]
MARETTTELFIRFLQRAKPLRSMPLWVRYGLTLLIVLICFSARYALGGIYPYPYLVFLPGIVFASFVFDRGSGFLATFVSAALALYFFVEPRTSFVLSDIGSALSVIIFTFVGLLTAAIIEALRLTVEELAETVDQLGQSRRRLTDSLNVLEIVIEGTPDPIFVKDRDGRFVRVNSVLAQIMGVPKDVLLGKRDRDFLPEEQAEKIESVDRVVMETRSPFMVEELINVAGDGPRWFLSTKAPWYGPDGSTVGLIGISRNIDERKRAEDEVRSANQQKDLLLYDINHRVKNHLQSVMATLSTSRRRISDAGAREAIDTTITRLSVLSRVYDRLELKPGGEASVGARDFVEGLCADLKPTLIHLRPIALRVQVAQEAIDLGRAVSVGLLINEALTNALKYAFPDDRAGNVLVRFEREGDQFHVEVADDGVGMSAEQRGSGTGTKLMRALAQQLGGTIEWRGPPGTQVGLTFPANGPK